jgi:hypothetical protein
MPPMKGTISLFGFPSKEAALEVLPRSTGWRGLRAAGFMAAGLALAPAVGLVPPHAPWALLALGLGGFLGIRKWKERYTIVGFQGECPKCGGSLSIPPGTPLRPVMTLSCPGCNLDSRLSVTAVERPTPEDSAT